jgi:hypothetical protein
MDVCEFPPQEAPSFVHACVPNAFSACIARGRACNASQAVCVGRAQSLTIKVYASCGRWSTPCHHPNARLRARCMHGRVGFVCAGDDGCSPRAVALAVLHVPMYS